MVSYNSQNIFTKKLVEYILSRISGTNVLDRYCYVRPDNYYILGTLASQKKKKKHDFSSSEGASVRAQKMSVSFLVSNSYLNSYNKINVEIAGHIYYKVNEYEKNLPSHLTLNMNSETDEEDSQDDDNSELQRNPADMQSIWKRDDFGNSMILDLENAKNKISFHELIEKINSDIKIGKKIPLDLWDVYFEIDISDYSTNLSIVTLSLINESSEPEKFDGYCRTLFNCNFTTNIGQTKIHEFDNNYKYENYPQKYFYEFRTLNCQCEWKEENNIFITKHFAKHEQINIKPRAEIEGIDLSFSSLKTEDGLSNLERLVKKMTDYSIKYKESYANAKTDVDFLPREKNSQRTYLERNKEIEHFDILTQRVKDGVNLILSNEEVRNAFLYTNETFESYYLAQNIENARWRNFQIIFILVLIESIIGKKNLEMADVLHVSTGGGKSEAYFGLITFLIFYDRLIGKNHGVTALVKFPLRMLSIQQLERISAVLIHAEKIRQFKLNNDNYFSLGYYVGESDEFPNLFSGIETRINSFINANKSNPESIIIPDCPLCKNNKKGKMLLYVDDTSKRVYHQCNECQEKFFIYQTDREIFRWRPTVIISTVDKWAGLSLQRRLRNVLGGNGSMCPSGHGFIPSGDLCETTRDESFRCENVGLKNGKNNSPILSVQDEMHLLREGFGTISAHFEGCIETLVQNFSNQNIKYVAMSATLNGTDKQIEQLYRKDTFVIPGKCPLGEGSKDDLFFEKIEHPNRKIFSLKPNIRDNHYACLRTLLHFAEFLSLNQKNLLTDSKEFCFKYGLNNETEGWNLIKMYLIPLTYHIKKQDAYDMFRLKDIVINDSLLKNQNSYLQGDVISGDSRLEDLKKTIQLVRSIVKDFSFTDINARINYNSIYATSVVSHGVDLEELNFMLFQGIPYSTSEYIQALSRVGRKDLGIIFLWFYPNRVRDDSFYRNFQRYHETIDHYVKPVPINRYSKLGLHQTINSLFCCSILNYLSNIKNKPIYNKEEIRNLTITDLQNAEEFIENAYGRKLIDINIKNEVEERIEFIKLSKDRDKKFFPHILSSSGRYFYRNQTGMRGIQKILYLELYSKDKKYVE